MHTVLRRIATVAFASSLFGASLHGQTPMPVSASSTNPVPPQPGASSSLVPQKAAPAEMAPATPVATLQGLCNDPASKAPGAQTKAKACKTVITKAQLDSMLDILLPGAAPEVRHQFALNYIRIVAASGVAQQKHLEKDPAIAKELETRVQFTRMQVLASSLYRTVEKAADVVPESAIEKFYADHADSFIQGDVQRLTFAKTAPDGTLLDPVELRTKAEEFRARAVKGEDFDALQKEIVQTLTPGATVPPTSGRVRRGALTPAEAAVFDLKPGDFSPVLSGPKGLEILKLVSVHPMPLQAVREEIKTSLTNDRLRVVMKDETKDVTGDFNLAYLGLPSAPELFLSPSLNAPPSRPGTPNAPGTPAGRPGANIMPPR